MRSLKWVALGLAFVILFVGNVLRVENVFQASTGWIGFFSFLAAFLVLLRLDQLDG